MAAESEASEGKEAFILRHEVNAPRDLVFKAWTDPEHLAQWFGPRGFKLSIQELELRPGGRFHYRMSAPNGAEMWGLFVYREIEPPARLVYVSSLSDEQGEIADAPFSDKWPKRVHNVITFTEEGERTIMEMTSLPINATDEEAEFFAGMHNSMRGGWAGTLEQLDAHLAKKKGDRT